MRCRQFDAPDMQQRRPRRVRIKKIQDQTIGHQFGQVGKAGGQQIVVGAQCHLCALCCHRLPQHRRRHVIQLAAPAKRHHTKTNAFQARDGHWRGVRHRFDIAIGCGRNLFGLGKFVFHRRFQVRHQPRGGLGQHVLFRVAHDPAQMVILAQHQRGQADIAVIVGKIGLLQRLLRAKGRLNRITGQQALV